MKMLKVLSGAVPVAALLASAACSAPAPETLGSGGTGAGAAPAAGGAGVGSSPGAGGIVGAGSTPGAGGVPGNVGGSGAAPGAGGGAGATPGDMDPIGGYHVNGDWAGFAFTFATEATIMPADFGDLVDVDGPYCVSGTVSATEEYTSIAAFGVNFNQDKVHDAEVKTILPQGDGLRVDLTVTNPDHPSIRIQLEDLTDPSAADAADHRWCANIPAVTGPVDIPWDVFNTACWDDSGDPYDPSIPLAKAIAYVPDPGPMGTDLAFDFCVNDIGPTNVQGRGEGQIVADCGASTSWTSGNASGAFMNVASTDNNYQFQTNGWNLMGGNQSFTLLSGGGFKVDSQTCNTTTDAPCTFPSVYIGTDADGERTNYGNAVKQISGISAIPTCLGWNSGGTPASDEYNVSYDVWFNGDPGANYADKFLMVWFRDPPSFQPGGMFPEQNGVVIGGQTWQVWQGPNHAQQSVVSYVAPNPRADGQAYEFNLKDFIDDAVERGYLDPNQYLIAVMAGMEAWGGAQGASITGFRADVQ